MVTKENKSFSYKNEWLIRCGWVARCNTAPRDRDFLACLGDLETLTRWLESEYSLKLPRLILRDEKDLKTFCDGMLDRSSTHPWGPSLRGQHACLRTRSSVASSVFLFRKTLPQVRLSKREAERKLRTYAAKMSSPQEAPLEEMMQFARELISKEFRVGWDKKWHHHVDNFTLPVKSCLENSSGAGGARSIATREDRDEVWRQGVSVSDLESKFLDFVSDEETGPRDVQLNNSTRLTSIWTGGKNRIVSVFSAERSFLTPLHKTMYDFISSKEWLLRGEAEPGVFSEFPAVEGEVFVSGDYESASDNLNIHLSELILEELALLSRHVPFRVWREARRALRAEFTIGGVQARGQLMGSLLSFPLLCITNYIAFKYSVRRDVPVKINGDDIVFRATIQEYHDWKKCVSDFGLTLSVGKTLVTRTLFSLNSNFFLGRRNGVQQVAHIRSACVFLKGECAGTIQGRIIRSVVGFSELTSRRVHAVVLRRNSQHLWACQRSLLRGLRVDVSIKTIKAAGLIAREAFYLSQAFEPKPVDPWARWHYWALPAGWDRVWTNDVNSESDFGFGFAMVRSCWEGALPPPESIGHQAYLDRLRESTSTYVPYFSKETFTKWYPEEDYVKRRDYLTIVPRPRQEEGKWVWRKTRMRGVAFTSAGFVN